MPYSFLTLGQAKQALIQRLYVATNQFFTDAEIGLYLIESLQIFNAFANFYRQEFTFTARPGVTWYDLTDITNLPNTLRPLTTTDTALVQLIEYHLLEPLTSTYPLIWIGSKQFAITDLLNALQQMRDQLISDSGCTITESLVAAVGGRTFLPDTAISLRRVTWLPTSGFGYTPNNLRPSDLWSDQSFTAGFPQLPPGYPQMYRRSTEPPLSFDVDIQPAVPGQYDILTLNAGLALSTIQPSIMPVPNDWCSIIKWGAMAQLFGRDSSAADYLRAQYCLTRYKQGVAAMLAAPALIGARINDVPVSITGLTDADFYAANWQGQAPGSPAAIYYAGMNLLALAAAPDSNGPYSVTASVVRNMVLPVADSDYLQIGRDDVSPVLDHGQHIAMFKGGGEEFTQTFPLFQNFMRHCALYNSKLAALSPYLEMLDGRSREDERLNPMFSKVTPATTETANGR